MLLHVTAVQPAVGSFVTAYPADEPRPNASNLNFIQGQTTSNLVLAKVSPTGTVSLYNAVGAVHLIADVVGWVAPSGLQALLTPSPDRLATAGRPALSGGTELRDEAIITLGTATAPGDLSQAKALAAKYGGTVVGGYEEFGIFQIQFPSLLPGIGSLHYEPDVAGAWLSTWGGVGLDAEPPGDWSDDGPAGTWQFGATGAQDAWDRTTGSDVRVGVVDVGTAQATHEDLNVEFPPGPRTPAAWHATHVSGLACAKANGLGVVGMAWGCPIISAGVTDGSWQSAFQAAASVLDQGVKVINLSLGHNFEKIPCATQADANAVGADLRNRYGAMFEHLMGSDRGANVVWTLSAGNDCVAGMLSPMVIGAVDGALGNVLVVEATNSDGSLATFSNFRTGGNQIGAPGGVLVPPTGDGETGIWSTTTYPCPGNNACAHYAAHTGTSMASPIVAGVVALAASYHPTKTASQLVSCVIEGARVHGKLVGTRSTLPAGWGPAPSSQLSVYQVWAPGALDCPAPAPRETMPVPFPCTDVQPSSYLGAITVINGDAAQDKVWEIGDDCVARLVAKLGKGARITFSPRGRPVMVTRSNGSYCSLGWYSEPVTFKTTLTSFTDTIGLSP